MNLLEYAAQLSAKLKAVGKPFALFKAGKSLEQSITEAEATLGEKRPDNLRIAKVAPAAIPQSAGPSWDALKARLADLEKTNAELTARGNATQAAEIARLNGELTTAKAAITTAQTETAKTKDDAEMRANKRAIDILAAAGGAPLMIGAISDKHPAYLGKKTDGAKGFDKVRAAFKAQIENRNNNQ
jgi:hypothetical protein